ncbi:MAG: MaoC/PaaZ C-terminal domain-containing protein [Kofleriaceae bacterium]
MTLNLALVGTSTDPITTTYTWRDTVLYALGVGARLPDELSYVNELDGPKVLPTFAVVPSFTAMFKVASQLGANMAMVVHGEQTIRLHRAIPPSGTLSTVATVNGIYDKGKGALAVVEARTVDADGVALFDNVFSIFVRGAGGFGGERGPEAAPWAVAEGRAPDFAVTERTSAEQAALYRLSGDLNPLHISPSFAKAVGFERPILHGLCTYGFAGRALLASACGGDPLRLRSMSARFSAPVLPGDTLTTEGWRDGDGRYLVRVKNQDDKAVLTGGVAEIAPA